MKIKQRAFPHPVVGNGDDVHAGFQAPVEIKRRGDFIEIDVTCQMRCQSLQDRIDAKDASYGVHIECSKTFYRELIRFKPRNGSAKISIPITKLSGSVELNVVIFATREIAKYRVKEAHEDYGRRTFYVSEGDFLAVTEGNLFNADIHQDMLESVDSIMEVRQRTDKRAEMGVDYGKSKITVLLPKEDYQLYKEVSANTTFQAIAISSIVLPVLMEALKHVAEGTEEYTQCRWYDNLVLRLAQKGLEPTNSPFDNAQELLEMPVNQSLTSFRDLIFADDDPDE